MKFQTPKNFGSISVAQYVELLELNPEDFDSSFEFQIERLSIILDEDAEYLEDNLNIEELSDLNSSTAWIKGRIKGEFLEQYGEFKFKPLEKLTLGEFIDLENLFSKGYYLNIKKILAILYRRVTEDQFKNEYFEPYNFDLEKRTEFFNDFRMNNAQSIIDKYVKYREFFISKRKTLFKNDDEKEIEENEIDEPKTREEIEEEKQEKVFERWGWEFMIYKLCKGDLTKVEAVTELNLILVFNFEAMKKELNVKDF